MKNIFYLLAFITFFSCTKTKTEFIEVEVDKKYSWKEVPGFTGNDRIFLSSGGNADALYFQQPYGFSEVKGTAINKITIYDADFSTEISTRIPISPNFSAHLVKERDTLLFLFNNKYPIENTRAVQLNLKSIDPTLVSVKKNYNTYRSKSMEINKNGTLILSYANNNAENPYTLLLINMKTANNYPNIQTVFTKKVAIPRLSPVYSEISAIIPIDDYFIVNCFRDGIYKVKEDGTFRKIMEYGDITTIYKHGNNVYMHDNYLNKVLISSDNSENWQQYNISSEFQIRGKYSVIKDSLVAIREGSLFTLKWNGTSYTQRFLKNDGFESTQINGIEILKDTVYVATTSGLYAKPVSTFFDTKK